MAAADTPVLPQSHSDRGIWWGHAKWLRGLPQHWGNEIDKPHLINPACLVLRIDVGESWCNQYGAQILPGHLFFEPEAFSGWDYRIASAVKYENRNAEIRNLAVRREGGEFGLIGVEGGEQLRTHQIDSTGHECVQKLSALRA